MPSPSSIPTEPAAAPADEAAAESTHQRSSRWILAARVLGLGVVLLSLRWILLRLGADGAELKAFRPAAALFVVGAFAVPVWSACGLLPGLAWRQLVAVLSPAGADGRRDLRIFARLQISKYLPGHAFQVARHATTRIVGGDEPPPHGALAAAATCEVLGTITASATLALVAFSAAVAGGAIGLGLPVPESVLVWAPGAAIAVVLAFPWLLAKLAGGRWLPGVAPHDSRALLPAVGLYLLHVSAAGVVLGALLATTTDLGLRACLLAGLAAYPLAWLTGFLTPATPAGAGAVEAVLVATLGSRFGAVEVLAAAVALRVVMVAGDALLAFGAHVVGDGEPAGVESAGAPGS